ncbi:hypothetical protein ACFOEK_19965 [Litoribrevibacter euphylliae]|uniref:Transmembrane protein n=1 Tax=Litoribrevibacter euphylliae TaxID=1834034 RepID=A0ABV7HPV3_9GAMM
MKNLKGLVLGFVWGVGFSFACLLVLTVYMIHVEPEAKLAAYEELGVFTGSYHQKYYAALDPKLERLEIKDQDVLTSVSLNPIPINLIENIRLSISVFGTEGQFLAVCDEVLGNVVTNNERYYLMNKCPVYTSDVTAKTVKFALKVDRYTLP